MYKIIGADQKEYGPVTADQLREWIQTGRADAQTRVQVEGRTGWQTLAELPDFANALAAHSPAPPLPPAAAPKTSRMAMASLVLGVLGVVSCGVTSLVGLVLGIVALVKINKSQGRLSGNGLAIAGIVVSGLFVLLLPLFAGLLLPALAKAKARAQTIQCVNNVKQLTLAAIIYANDNDGRLPDAAAWCELVQTNVGAATVFLCPAGTKTQRCHYAFNAALSSAELNRLESPARTVLFVESEGGWNRSGGLELLSQSSRHGRQIVVGFADGHVETLQSGRLENLRWAP